MMKKAIRFIFVFIMLLPLIVITSSSAEDDTPRIVSVKGSVQIQKSGGLYISSAYKGMKIDDGDIIITDLGSSAIVNYYQKEMVVGELAQVYVNSIWNRHERDDSSVSLIEGMIKNRVDEKLDKNSSNVVRAANTVAGVRGTEYVLIYSRMGHEDGGDVNPFTKLKVLDGEVRFDLIEQSSDSGEPAQKKSYLVDTEGAKEFEEDISGNKNVVVESDGQPAKTPDNFAVSVDSLDKSILEDLISNPKSKNQDQEFLKQVDNALVSKEKEPAKRAEKPQPSFITASEAETILPTLPKPDPVDYSNYSNNTYSTAATTQSNDVTSAPTTSAETASAVTENSTQATTAATEATTQATTAATEATTQATTAATEATTAATTQATTQATTGATTQATTAATTKATTAATTAPTTSTAATPAMTTTPQITTPQTNITSPTEPIVTTEAPKTSISSATVTVTSSHVYNKSEQIPEFTVSIGSNTLTYNTDYSYTLSDNINAGTATITITGIGKYTGTKTKTFEIAKTEQEALIINTPTAITYGMTGLSLSVSGGSGEGEVNYAVTSGDAVSVAPKTGMISLEKAGTVIITATKAADDNYNSVTATATLVVEKRSLSSASVSANTLTYNGLSQTPTPTVTDGDLIKITDYTVQSYENNTNAGTAKITITATENGNYTGSVSGNFIIEKAPLTVTASSQSISYQESANTFLYSLAGFVNSENESKVSGSPAFSCDYSVGDSADNYEIKIAIGTLSADNYSFTGFTSGWLSVGKIDQDALTLATSDTATSYEYMSTGISLITSGGSGTGAVSYAVTSGSAVSVNSSTGEVLTLAAGNATITATKAGDKNYAAATATIDLTITERAISSATFSVSSATYDTTSKAPTITVADSGTLVKGVDYDYSFDAKTNAGDYTITISGMGNYNGTKDVTFTIDKVALTLTADTKNISFNDTAPTYTYTATGLVSPDSLDDIFTASPLLACTYSSGDDAGTYSITCSNTPTAANYTITFVSGTLTVAKLDQAEFTLTAPNDKLSYKYGDTLNIQLTATGGTGSGAITFSSGDTTVAAVGSSTGAVSLDSYGTATITATKAGGANYNDATATITLTFEKRSLSNISVAEITGIIYDGTAQTPTPTITDGDLILSTDYAISSYSNNTAAGTASLTISATETGNYTGTKIVEFTIAKKSVNVTAENKTITYLDSAPQYTYAFSGFEGTDTDSVVTGTPTLSSTYTSSSSVGTYDITIDVTGLSADNYTFTGVTGTLTVEAKAIVSGSASVSGTFTYTGAAQTPTPTVTVGGTTLVADTDYTVSYSDNTDAGTATITVTGIGDYGGSDTVDFTISAAALTVTASNKSLSYRSAVPTYDVTYSGFVSTEDESVLSGTLAYACDYTNTSSVGTYSITPSGLTSSNYSITFTAGTLTVSAKALSSATIISVTSSHTYTGSAQTPTYTVADDSVELVAGTDFTASLSDNTNAGTATITLTGTGNYSGTATETFTIAKADQPTLGLSNSVGLNYGDVAFELSVTGGAGTGAVTYATSPTGILDISETGVVSVEAAGTTAITVSKAADDNYNAAVSEAITFTVSKRNISNISVAAIDAVTYTGSQLEPTAVLTDMRDADNLVKSGDFTVTYSDNTNAGTATVTITPADNGNYTGTAITTTFTISPIELTITTSNTLSPINTTATVSVSGVLEGEDAGLTLLDTVTGITLSDGTLTYDGTTEFTTTSNAIFNVTNTNYTFAEEVAVTVCDGQASDRPIPVNGDNVTAFNTYANTTVGLTRHYIQTENITLTDEWTAIGTSTTMFSGSYDGDGYTISGLTISASKSNQGLFGYTDTTAVLKNIGLLNANIKGDANTGGIVGNNLGTVSNCYTTGAIKGSSRISGIAGNNTGTVEYCWSSASVFGSTGYVGGIVGNGTGTVTNSVAMNTLVYAPMISSASYVSAVSGTDCYAREDMPIIYSGNVWLAISNTISQTEWSDIDWWYDTAGFDREYWNESNLPLSEAVIISSTEDNPFLVTSEADLRKIGTGVDGWTMYAFYKQTADIELTSEWTPIGSSSTTFTGVFDGNGKTISKLTINATSDNQGLFGYTQYATVKNVGLIDVDITSTALYVGGIVGKQYYGTITNCYVTGSVSAGRFVGGFVGYRSGGTMSKCVALNSSVTATSATDATRIGRVSGCTAPTNSYARPDMVVTYGSDGSDSTAKEITSDANGVDGLDITFDQWGDIDWWRSIGFDSTNWNADNLPLDLVPPNSEQNPYLVTNETDLRKVGTGTDGWTLDAHYKQTADITLTSNWTAIGTNTTKFSGSYNGDGYTISGLKINLVMSSYQGLFGYTDTTAVLKNIGLLNVNISSGGTIGGIVGYNLGTVSNCYTTGIINGSTYIGGVAGRNTGTIEYCWSTASVIATINYAGGIAGDGSSNVANCIAMNTKVISASSSTAVYVSAVNGTDCFAREDIPVIYNGNAQLDLSNTISQTEWSDIDWWHETAGFKSTYWTSSNLPLSEVVIPASSADNPFLVSSEADLRKIGTGVDGWELYSHYKQTADITLTSEWTPIGTASATAFTGIYDGNGYTISDLTITSTSTYLGLFGYVTRCTVKNVGLIDVAISSSADYVGGIVGFNKNGTITNCYVTGSVSGRAVVGGIVGTSSNGTISNCVALNSSVTSPNATSASYIARISGDQAPSNCYARSDMIITYGSSSTPKETTSGTSSKDGLDITSYECGNIDWWRSIGFDSTYWNESNLPLEEIPPNSEQNPYRVTNETDLRKVGTGTDGWTSDAYYKQTADITLTSEWTPIASFRGTYDGGGKTISGLTITNSTSYYQGLFGTIAWATIKNVGLIDVNITSTEHSVGGITGNNEGGTITNCYVTGSISGGGKVGGISGTNNSSISTVSNCWSSATLISSVSDNYYIGGIVGNNYGVISNCVALNPSVTVPNITSTLFQGRVSGANAPTNSYARSDMIITYGAESTPKTTTSSMSGMDGLDITSAEWSDVNWWYNTVGFDSTYWNASNLPLDLIETMSMMSFILDDEEEEEETSSSSETEETLPPEETTTTSETDVTLPPEETTTTTSETDVTLPPEEEEITTINSEDDVTSPPEV